MLPIDSTGKAVVGDLTGVTLPTVVQLTVKADARIGEGENDLIGTVDVEIVPGEAVTINVGGTTSPV